MVFTVLSVYIAKQNIKEKRKTALDEYKLRRKSNFLFFLFDKVQTETDFLPYPFILQAQKKSQEGPTQGSHTNSADSSP